MRNKSLLKAIVVVHGRCEYNICRFIKTNLRMKMNIFAKDKGRQSIQISSLKNQALNKDYLRSFSAFKRIFKNDFDFKRNKRPLSEGFKIFIIMDTDDCSSKEREEFVNKNMFKDHWAYDYIIPIFNTPNLDKVLQGAGYKIDTSSNKPNQYEKFFPINDKLDIEQVKELKEKLEKNQDTNLVVFLEYCLDMTLKN